MDRIEECFRRQPPGKRMRKVNVVILVPLAALYGVLVSARGHDKVHELASIKTRSDEVPGETLKQRRIRRRVAGPNIIYRIDNADPEEIAPQAMVINKNGKIIGAPSGFN